MNSQTSTKQMKARPNKKTAKRVENTDLCYETKSNIYNDGPAISSPVASRKLIRLSTHRTSSILGRTGHSV